MTYTTVVRPGKGRELSIAVEAPNWLHRGAGLHRLTLPIRLDTRNTISSGVPLRIQGQAWLGQIGGDWLGSWSTESAVVTYDQPFQEKLVLPLTDEQLAVIEHRRSGADLQISFNIDVEVGYDPLVADRSPDERWPTSSGQLTVHIYRETWARLLTQVGIGSSLAVVVPVPLGPGAGREIGDHLREAVRKINAGEYSDAVIEARKAIDVMRALSGEDESERAIVQIKSFERTLRQRLALVQSALHSLASPAAHGDPNATAIRWTRETALAAVAGIAALAACRAEFVEPADVGAE